MRSVSAFVILLMASVTGAAAQNNPSAGRELSGQEALGFALWHQHCGVCHANTIYWGENRIRTGTYGPDLSWDSLGGDPAGLAAFISFGTNRMPGFRHRFTDEEIAAIVAFIKTIPPRPGEKRCPVCVDYGVEEPRAP
jgi:mono/diheme cytochrome c family protein